MILDDIIAHKRQENAPLRARYVSWTTPATTPRRRGFADVIRRKAGVGLSALVDTPALQHRQPPKVALIAEFKRRSPSKGDIRPGAEPAAIARSYEAAGASAMSVLTDKRFFGGCLDDMFAARGACQLPVLRKDFIIEPCQIVAASGLDGPDCLLLIAAVLTLTELRELRELAASFGQEALVEAHNEEEVEHALESGATIIGINNRDLQTFTVSLETTRRLRPRIPAGVTVVSESGIHTRDDVLLLAELGVDAMLVGEALMAAADPAAKIKELLGTA